MNKNVLLNQVYWPTDTVTLTDNKWQRLITIVAATVFGSRYAWEITIRRHAKKRSGQANNYLWGVCYVLLSDASGYEKEEIHELMCGKFFGTKIVEIMGVKKRVPMRSTTYDEDGNNEVLDVETFAKFVEFVIREASIWYDVVIPEPTTEQVPRG